MKINTLLNQSRRLSKLFAALGLAGLAASPSFAANGTWTNAPVSGAWTNVLNWNAGVVPGTINNVANNGIDSTSIATFTNAITTYGGAANPIIPDDGTVTNGKSRMVAGVVFDGANCGSYVFYSPSAFQAPNIYYTTNGSIITTNGNPETGVLSLCVGNAVNNSSTNMSMITAPVTHPQNFLIPVQIRLPSSDNGVYFFSNGATAASATFYFNNLFLYPGATTRGAVFDFTGPNTGTNTVALLNFNASAAAACGIRKEGSGRWILSGNNTVPSLGFVSILGGTLEVQNSGVFGSFATVSPTITNGTLQIDNVTLNQNSFILQNGGTIRMDGAGTINGINIGNQPATSVTIATTAATDVFTIGNGGNTLKGGAADTVIHLAGPGTNLLANDATTLTNAAWSFDGGVAQVGSGNALGATPRTLAFGSASTGKLQLNANNYTALAVTSSPTAGSPIIENGGGGAAILTVSNAAANTFAGVIQDGVGGGNLGLTKAALGTLTLSGASTYTGNTTINNGALNLTGSLGSTAVTVNSGGTLTGSGSIVGSATVGSGGTLLPGGSANVGTITVGSLTMNSGSTASFEFNGTTNDLVMVNTSGGLTINGGLINLYQSDGVTTFASAGTYNLIKYSGSISGAVANLSVGNPQAGFAYAFGTSAGYVTLTITVSGVNTAWNVDADGNWSTGGNWAGGTAPHNAGDSAKLGVGTSLRTVTLNVNESVGGITFTNNNSFVIANAGSKLTLDNKGAGAPISVQAGTANVIQTAVSFNDNVTATASSGKSLGISGTVSDTGAHTLTVNGAGTVALSGNNTYGPSAGTVATILTGGGTLNVGNSGALGGGDVDVTGNSTLQAGAAGLTVPNNVIIESLINGTVDANGQNFTLSGTIEGNGNLTKIGAGTLVLANNGNSYAGNTTVNAGVLSVSANGDLGANPANEAPNIFLNGGDLLGSATFNLLYVRDIGVGPVSGSVGTNALIDAASGQTFTINGAIASAGNSGVNGLGINTGTGNTGEVVLGGVGTFNGPTYIAQGELDLANSLALQNSTLDYTNGTLWFDSSITAATIAEIVGTQSLGLTNLNGNPVTLTLGGNNASYTNGVTYTDGGAGGSLNWNGSGTLTFVNSNSYSGNTSVNEGILQLYPNGVINSTGICSLAKNNPATYPAQMIVNGGVLYGSALNVGAYDYMVVSNGGLVSITGGVTEQAIGSEASAGGLMQVSGGSLNAASLTVGRGALATATQPVTGSTIEGFYINGGAANFTNNVGVGTPSYCNSTANMRIDGGSVTVGGSLTVGLNNPGRWSQLDVTGGSLTVTDTVTGINLGGPYVGAGELLLVRGGTVNAGIITLGNGTNGGTAAINITNGSLYLGAGGIVQVSSNAVTAITLNGGVLGASAAWSSTNPMTLGGTVIQAADAGGTAHNITLTGALGGTTLTKTGNGTLTLTAANFYNGGVNLNAGTLNINGSYALGGGFYAGLTFNGGTLQFAPAFSGNGPGDFSENTAATPVPVPVTFASTATIDVNGNTVACAADLGNHGGGGLIVQDSTGGGRLYLQTNSYTGNTTVNSGATLELANPMIYKNSTVTVATGGVLQLDFSGANIVTNIVLGGVTYNAPGTYNHSNHAAFITGTGSLVISSSTIAPTDKARITGFSLSGGNVLFSATNGDSGATYYLVDSTNLAVPIPQWKTIWTNVAGAQNFSFTATNAVKTGSAQQFYLLSSTNYNP